MTAAVVGTPVEVDFASGADPSGVSVTVDAEATAAYFFWNWYATGAQELGLASVTLGGVSPDEVFERPQQPPTGDEAAGGVAIWYDPPTGSQTLDPAWDDTPDEGPACAFVTTKDGDTAAARDIDGHNAVGAGAVSVTLTTEAGDLVLKFDANDSSGPSLSDGWDNVVTGSGDGSGTVQAFRVSSIVATGASQVCDAEDEAYSVVIAVAIPPAAGGGATIVNREAGRRGIGRGIMRGT